MAPLTKSAISKPGKPFEPLVAANDNRPMAVIDGETLFNIEFPPVDFVIPQYITEGLTILAGRPKLGKSWLALGMCIAVATGGNVLGEDCDQGDALYLALEDNQRRLHDRLRVVCPPQMSRPNLGRVSFQTTAPLVGSGLIEHLNGWRQSVENPKLIVIDTLAKVRPPKKGNQDNYSADYAAIVPLQEFALEHRLAVVVVHHVRKMEADDPLEAVSGTNGLTGAADTTMVLDRRSDGPKLYARGRDIEEVDKALKFDQGVWSVLGNADDVKQSEQRLKIIEVLSDAVGVMMPSEIAKEANLSPGSVRHLLGRMVKDGKVEKSTLGAHYKLVGR